MSAKLTKRTAIFHGESLVFYCSDEELSDFIKPRSLNLMWFWKVRETDPNLSPAVKAAIDDRKGKLDELEQKLLSRFRPAEGEKLEKKKRSVAYQGETLEFYCADEELDYFMTDESLDALWWRHQQEANPDIQSEWGDHLSVCQTQEELDAMRQEMYAQWRARVRRIQ